MKPVQRFGRNELYANGIRSVTRRLMVEIEEAALKKNQMMQVKTLENLQEELAELREEANAMKMQGKQKKKKSILFQQNVLKSIKQNTN